VAEFVFVARNRRAFQKKACALFFEAARQDLRKRGRFTVALSGGNTPKIIFPLLARMAVRSRIDWTRVYLFWGDERCVPPADPRSNYLWASRTFMSKVPIPERNIFRIPAELKSPQGAARVYEETLREFFGSLSRARFDFMFLGLGADGHTASLFPRSKILSERKRWVRETVNKGSPFYRISLTYPIINRSRRILTLCRGINKAPMVAQVLARAGTARDIPALGVRPKYGELIWLLDSEAASQLPERTKFKEVN